MPNRFVLDEGLLGKCAVGDGEYITTFELLNNMKKLERWDLATCKDIKYLVNLLSIEILEKDKYVLSLNDKIITKYNKHIGHLTSDLEEYMFAIISEDKHCIETKGGIDSFDIFEKIRSDEHLKNKDVFLDVAKSLFNRVIVATDEEIKSTYLKGTNRNILFNLKVNCKHTWEMLKLEDYPEEV